MQSKRISDLVVIPVTHAVYIIPGFKQHYGSRTLLWHLWRSLEGQLNQPYQTVQVRLWDNDWRNEAKFVAMSSKGCPTRDLKVIIVGYSWGAGWGAIQFAKRLAKHSIGVRKMCLIDPVYRHWYPWGNWRAYFPDIPITIPSNVDSVTWWRQTAECLRGHKIRRSSPNTELCEAGVFESVLHRQMDDKASVIQDCYDIIASEFS